MDSVSELEVPCGEVAPAPFSDAAEHRAAIDAVTGLLIAAIVADKASEADAADLRREAARRATIIDERAAGARARRRSIPLADAFDRLALVPDERAVLGALLGAELSPAIARAFATLGGVTVETIALLFGTDGVARLLALLAADAPLSRLALIVLAGDGPLLHRRLAVAPRLVPLALGSAAVDAALGAELQRAHTPSLAVAHADREACARLRGVLARETALPVGVLVAERAGGAVAIAADLALSLARPALIVRARADGAWCDAVAREALVQRAAVIVDGGPAARLVRRLAGLGVPIAIACDGEEAALEGLPELRIELPPSDREAMWRAALAGFGAEVDPRALAAIRIGAKAIAHAVAHARLLAEATGRTYLTRDDIADGLAAALAIGPFSRRGGALEPILPVAAGDRLRAITARADDGVVAMVTGGPGSGKTTFGRAVAAELCLDHVELDASIAGERPIADAFLAAEIRLIVLTLVNATPQLATRLRTCRGVVLLAAEREDDLDPVLRRVARQHVALRLAKEDRDRLWAAALPALADGPRAELARDLDLVGGQIVAIARLVGPDPTVEAVRAAARRVS